MMRKYVKIMVLALLTVGLVSGSAFAAASLNGGNVTVASEMVSATVATALPGTAANTAYQPGGAVAVTSQIKVSLTGGSFDTKAANLYNICQAAGTAMGTTPAVAGGATSFTVTLTSPLASGTVYTIQSDGCVGFPVALGTAVRIDAGTLAGGTVVITADNALNPGDPNIYATTTLATINDQFSATLVSAAADLIDFGAVPSMTKFKAGGSGTATTSVAKLAILSNETLGTKIGTNHAGVNTTCAAFPATTEAISLTATPASGTMGTGFAAANPYLANAFAVRAGAITSTETSVTANPTLTANLVASTCGAATPAATITGLAANYITQTLTVSGTTALTARSYKLAVGTRAGTGAILAASRTLLAATTAWTWGLDASQYYIPLIGNNAAAGRETYIKLQSKSTLAGSNGVSVAILASDGTITATYAPGTITAGVPMTITGAQLIAAATAAGKTVDGSAGFAVIVTVNAPENDVFAYANMLDATGAKRIPVKTVNGMNVE